MIVVGSINVDVVLRCERLPGPGETVLATSAGEGFGGKGANQAVAAARLGAAVLMIGAVGADAAGKAARADLVAEGVDVAGVVEVAGSTGHATVLVDRGGENAIVVAPGANAALTAAMVGERLRLARLGPADVLLVSGEVPTECAEAAIRAGAVVGARAVFNLAPFRGLPDWLGTLRPLLVLNGTEAAQAARRPDPDAAAAALAERFGSVLVTRGGRGALLVDRGDRHEVPAAPVAPVDTTGAGDAFCGAVAAELAAGSELRRAVETAVRAAAVSVTGHGARGALATRADL